MPEKHRAFFKSYCIDCHNAETQEGKVRLDDLSYEITDIPNAEPRQKILNALNSGELPPEDEKQPTRGVKTEFLDHLPQAMVTARKTLTDQGRVITMRRLNRREYENTIHDLLGVPVDVKTLPSAVGSGGFDRSLKISVHQAIQKHRINAAKDLLSNTGLVHRVIAERLGFTSEQNFASWFHRVQGIPPGVFRNTASLSLSKR